MREGMWLGPPVCMHACLLQLWPLLCPALQPTCLACSHPSLRQPAFC